MKLVYYRKQVPNFGDDLNAALWPALAPGLFDDDPRYRSLTAGAIMTIGLDPVMGMRRYTFGMSRLNAGVDLLAFMIGMFAISEILRPTFRQSSNQ